MKRNKVNRHAQLRLASSKNPLPKVKDTVVFMGPSHINSEEFKQEEWARIRRNNTLVLERISQLHR